MNSGECEDKKTHDDGCMGYEEKVQKLDSEKYGHLDVSLILDQSMRSLQAYKETGCPSNLIQKEQILVDALTLLLKQLNEGGEP